jgi:hypothetical protein
MQKHGSTVSDSSRTTSSLNLPTVRSLSLSPSNPKIPTLRGSRVRNHKSMKNCQSFPEGKVPVWADGGPIDSPKESNSRDARVHKNPELSRFPNKKIKRSAPWGGAREGGGGPSKSTNISARSPQKSKSKQSPQHATKFKSIYRHNIPTQKKPQNPTQNRLTTKLFHELEN